MICWKKVVSLHRLCQKTIFIWFDGVVAVMHLHHFLSPPGATQKVQKLTYTLQSTLLVHLINTKTPCKSMTYKVF